MSAVPLPAGFDASRLSPEQQDELIALLEEDAAWRAQRLFYAIFPDEDRAWDGPPVLKGLIATGQTIHARSKYPRHIEFFRAGARYRERCFMAANRVGKTFAGGGYETACHLTGLYPPWWEGRRFDHAVYAWAAGDTLKTVREIVQPTLLGEVTGSGPSKAMDGRGVIPGDRLVGRPSWAQGVSDLVDTVQVMHVSGEMSLLGLKSYDQGRRAFQGTGQHFIWFDEEPPADVYGEAVIRTMTTDGAIVLTFTPLTGHSEVVMGFLPGEMRPEG